MVLCKRPAKSGPNLEAVSNGKHKFGYVLSSFNWVLVAN